MNDILIAYFALKMNRSHSGKKNRLHSIFKIKRKLGWGVTATRESIVKTLEFFVNDNIYLSFSSPMS